MYFMKFIFFAPRQNVANFFSPQGQKGQAEQEYSLAVSTTK